MKVKVDLGLCEANALCVRACPDVFQLTEDDDLVLLLEEPDEALREDVEAAARLCPRLAITIQD